MTSIRRVAPLSLALSVVLLAGSASAAPSVKGEGVLKSFTKAVAAGVRVGKAEFKQRREKAGPGLIQRTMTGAREFLAERADSARVSIGTATAATAAATKTKAVAARNGIVGSIKSTMAAIAERRAQAKALRAANKDIESFFNEKGNEDLRTYLAGAKKESGVGFMRGIRNASAALSATGAGLAAVTGDAGPMIYAGTYVGTAALAHHAVKTELRSAYTMAVQDAVNRPVRVDSARLEGWVKAGAIDDFTK